MGFCQDFYETFSHSASSIPKDDSRQYIVTVNFVLVTGEFSFRIVIRALLFIHRWWRFGNFFRVYDWDLLSHLKPSRFCESRLSTFLLENASSEEKCILHHFSKTTKYDFEIPTIFFFHPAYSKNEWCKRNGKAKMFSNDKVWDLNFWIWIWNLACSFVVTFV